MPPKALLDLGCAIERATFDTRMQDHPENVLSKEISICRQPWEPDASSNL